MINARSLGVVASVALLAGAVATAPSGVTHAAPVAKKTATVKIVDTGNFAFSPAKLKVKVGTKVTWVNDTSAPHTVTGTGKWKFASKTFNQGEKVSYTFKKAGTYHYMCAIHPFMKAEVIVKK